LSVVRIALDSHAAYFARLMIKTIKSLAPPVTAI